MSFEPFSAHLPYVELHVMYWSSSPWSCSIWTILGFVIHLDVEHHISTAIPPWPEFRGSSSWNLCCIFRLWIWCNILYTSNFSDISFCWRRSRRIVSIRWLLDNRGPSLDGWGIHWWAVRHCRRISLECFQFLAMAEIDRDFFAVDEDSWIVTVPRRSLVDSSYVSLTIKIASLWLSNVA